MTAATLALRDQLLAVPGGIVADVDLWFPTQQDPVGVPSGLVSDWWIEQADPERYIVWVPTSRGAELAPRKALHVGLRARNARPPQRVTTARQLTDAERIELAELLERAP